MRNSILGVAIAAALITLFVLYLRHQTPPAADSGQETRADNGRVTADQSSGGGAGGGEAAGTAPALPGGEQEKIKLLKEMVARQPANAVHLLALANELYDDGKFTEAVTYYRQGVAADPTNNDARVDLATSLYQSGQPDEALRQIDSVLARNPRHANALYNRGVMEKSLGHIDEANRSWRAYVEFYPSGPRAGEIRAILNGGAPGGK